MKGYSVLVIKTSLFLIFGVGQARAQSRLDSAAFYNNRGVDYLLAQQFVLAEKQFLKAVGFDRKNELVWYNLGLAIQEQGRFDEALKYYKKALKLDKNYLSPREGMAKCYLQLKSYKKAKRQCNKILKLKPENYEALYNRGVANYELKNFLHALSDFSHASALGPFKNEPLIYMGIICLSENNFEGALPYFNKALENDSFDKIALYNRGLAHLGLGKIEWACNDFKQSAELGYALPENFLKLCNFNYE